MSKVQGAGAHELVEYLLRLGDDRLILGHRLSEWCGHGPILEEDIALSNLALDLIGQASLLLGLAGEVEGRGRDADALAYLRDAQEFRCHPMVELPRGDFAFTIVRQFLFGCYSWHLTRALSSSRHEGLAGIAAKAHKEETYHLRHTSEWMLRLGDGTEESHARAQAALEDLWRYTGTLFVADEVDRAVAATGVGVDPAVLEPPWRAMVEDVVSRATLTLPPGDRPTGRGYRRGDHTEHLGHLLAEMQVLPRTYPGARW
jgi:ring-1,2-phenylacetyl-CoA epoxidase subunit PaaC